MTMTHDEMHSMKGLAEEPGSTEPVAAQLGYKYDVRAARAKAEELRALARKKEQDSRDSFDRCDTDGALSQWAHERSADKYRLEASIVENGGMWTFPALFDLEGNLVPAREVYGPHGSFWSLLDEGGNRTGATFRESQAQNDDRRIANDRKKGYYVGTVLAPARAALRGGNITSVAAVIERADGGWDPNVIVVDSGSGEPWTP